MGLGDLTIDQNFTVRELFEKGPLSLSDISCNLVCQTINNGRCCSCCRGGSVHSLRQAQVMQTKMFAIVASGVNIKVTTYIIVEIYLKALEVLIRTL